MIGAMIAHLSGPIILREAGFVVIESGGVGYKIHISTETFAALKQKREAELWTHLAVREHAHELYGFESPEELSFFEMLVSISGIGPKSGLAILSLADVATLTQAISHGDSSYLTKVSGIGRKNAEKIILELKDKLGSAPVGDDGSLQDATDTLDALIALGYQRREAREALRQIPDEITDMSQRLKKALKILGGA